MTKRIKNKAPTESNIIPEPTPEVKKQSFKNIKGISNSRKGL